MSELRVAKDHQSRELDGEGSGTHEYRDFAFQVRL